MLEIVFVARGGQGAKTAAHLLATSAMKQGYFVQAWPQFGPERRGAKVKAYVRISESEILTHAPISEPDFLVVFEKTVLKGEQTDNTTILNYPSVEEAKSLANFKELYVLDATKIARETTGTAIPNIAMLGALVKVLGNLKLEIVENEVREHFTKKRNAQLASKLCEALKLGYENVVKA